MFQPKTVGSLLHLPMDRYLESKQRIPMKCLSRVMRGSSSGDQNGEAVHLKGVGAEWQLYVKVTITIGCLISVTALLRIIIAINVRVLNKDDNDDDDGDDDDDDDDNDNHDDADDINMECRGGIMYY